MWSGHRLTVSVYCPPDEVMSADRRRVNDTDDQFDGDLEQSSTGDRDPPVIDTVVDHEQLKPIHTLSYLLTYTDQLHATDFTSARQHYMLSALDAIARPSVCPSHGWISQKRLKLGLRNFHYTVAPRERWGNKPFSRFKRQYLENGRRYVQNCY